MEEYPLQEPLNFTDPYVLHDPAIPFPHVAKLYMPNYMNDTDDDPGNNLETHSLKTDGLMYPVIQVNTRVIDYNQIEKMVINYDSLVPTIYLKIKDHKKEIQAMDVPGLNNSIKVIIIPEVNYRYKSILLDFKITSCSINGMYVSYTGIYKLLAFNKEYTKEITYAGCSNSRGKNGGNSESENKETVSCNPNPNKKPNTWELLHEIALSCQLGFCSTDMCQGVNDRVSRLMTNQRYLEHIRQQIRWSGTDESNVMDCWVDLYGYIVLVNLSWLLTVNVSPNNLAIDAIIGMHSTDVNHTPDQNYKLVHRTLTNYDKTDSVNNLTIEFYRTIVHNEDLETGTSLSQYSFYLKDFGGNNSVEQYDVEIIQNSIDGQKVEEYSTQHMRNFAIECNEHPCNKQQLIRDKFLSKHRQRILEVKLKALNLGLQRGTLVNVIIFADSKEEKKLILSSSSNVIEPSKEIKEDNMQIDGISTTDLIEREDISLPNIGLSGMYYIDGMRFEYSYKENKISQYLLLIKRGSLSNLSNFETAPKLNNIEKQP